MILESLYLNIALLTSSYLPHLVRCWIIREKLIGIKLLDEREGCSKGGRYSVSGTP